MNYGLHLSTTGALVSLHKMDVLANNLANVGTVGFKPELLTAQQRNPARVEDGLGFMPSSRLLERLGGGVFSGPSRTSFEQGAPQATGSPLDLAIEGPGFFVVRDEHDASGDNRRLTRDGRFTMDRSGRLATATSGLPVMDVNNRPIALSDLSQVAIASDGSVRQGGALVAQIQVADVPDPTRLTKTGRGLFRAPAGSLAGLRPAAGQVRQGMVEASAVDPISTMLSISDAGRAAEANLTMIRNHDRLMDRAINSLGRVT